MSKCLEPELIISLFECLLIECRIIFVSKKLSRLSECVNAAAALLNPLSWQYVFIPVLPVSLLSYCCAPMPFIVGVTSGSMGELAKLPMEEVLMIDLDKGQFLAKPKNTEIISHEVRDELKTSIGVIKSHLKKSDKAFDLNIARCFLKIIYRFCGHYSLFITPTSFDTESFLESQPPQYLKVCCIIIFFVI